MAHVVGIAEIVLWTADKERALGFYRDLLGLELISPPTLRNAFLKAGEGAAGIPAMVVLVPKGDDVLGQPSGYQLHHLALALPPEAFDAQHDALVAAGYTPRGGKHPVLAFAKLTQSARVAIPARAQRRRCGSRRSSAARGRSPR